MTLMPGKASMSAGMNENTYGKHYYKRFMNQHYDGTESPDDNRDTKVA
jgi:hypothetical protein